MEFSEESRVKQESSAMKHREYSIDIVDAGLVGLAIAILLTRTGNRFIVPDLQ